MAIENTYLLGKNITLGCGFDLQAKAPLDSRLTVPATAGLQALINGDAAYEGMIVYDEESKKTYQAQKCDPYTVTIGEGDDAVEKTYSIAFREFGINESELKDLIASETTAAMEFKGVATTLPTSGAKGDMYKVTTGFTVETANDAQGAGFDAKVGDSIVCDGEGKWFLIPSGDDIEDTWRPVTDVDNDSTLTFVAGDKLDVTVASTGEVTYKHEAISAPTDNTAEGDERTRTYITAVETDGFGHITGYKTATENVEDTNTEYTFEGQSEDATSVYFQVTSNEEGASADVIYLNAYSKNEADAAFKAKRAEKLDAVATDANVFVDTVAQDVDGNITLTTKAVDFSGVNAEIAKKLDTETYNAYIAGKSMSDEELKSYADGKASAAQSAAEATAADALSTARGEITTEIGQAITDLELGTMSKKSADDYYTKGEIDGQAANYKTKQTAKEATETDANVFAYGVSQNENGEITVVTKAVDFTAINNELDKKLESVSISTGDAAGQIKYSVDGAEAINVDVNGFADKLDKSVYETYIDGKSMSDDELKKYTDDKIADLDVTDTAVEKQFVTAVSETDGKVSVERRALTKADIPTLDRNQVAEYNSEFTLDMSSQSGAGYLKLDMGEGDNHAHFDVDVLIQNAYMSEDYGCGHFIAHARTVMEYNGVIEARDGEYMPTSYITRDDGTGVSLYIPFDASASDLVTCRTKAYSNDVYAFTFVTSVPEGALATTYDIQVGTGLKATYNSNGVTTIDFDSDNVTFIFDCGTSAV